MQPRHVLAFLRGPSPRCMLLCNLCQQAAHRAHATARRLRPAHPSPVHFPALPHPSFERKHNPCKLQQPGQPHHAPVTCQPDSLTCASSQRVLMYGHQLFNAHMTMASSPAGQSQPDHVAATWKPALIVKFPADTVYHVDSCIAHLRCPAQAKASRSHGSHIALLHLTYYTMYHASRRPGPARSRTTHTDAQSCARVLIQIDLVWHAHLVPRRPRRARSRACLRTRTAHRCQSSSWTTSSGCWSTWPSGRASQTSCCRFVKLAVFWRFHGPVSWGFSAG